MPKKIALRKYIEFRTGLFELLKQHFVTYIDAMENVEVTKDPKEKRYNLDLV